MTNSRYHQATSSSGRRTRPIFAAVAVLGFPLLVFAAPAQIPHEFGSGEPVLASEFNENFDALAAAIDDNDARLTDVETDVMDFGGLPAGAVVFFNVETCPDGWTEMTGLRGRVPVGLPSGGLVGATVGSDLPDEGLRTISQVPSHTHSVNPPSANTTSGGSHTHSVDPPSTNTTSGGSHTHSVNPPSTNTTSGGSHTHTVNNGNGGLASSHLQAANAAGDGAVPDSSSPISSSGNHSHSVDIGSFNSASGGSHSHSVNIGAFSSASGGSHNHSVDIGSFNSAAAGIASVDVTMPYMQLLACSKN